jgi:hypothetical protein
MSYNRIIKPTLGFMPMSDAKRLNVKNLITKLKDFNEATISKSDLLRLLLCDRRTKKINLTGLDLRRYDLDLSDSNLGLVVMDNSNMTSLSLDNSAVYRFMPGESSFNNVMFTNCSLSSFSLRDSDIKHDISLRRNKIESSLLTEDCKVKKELHVFNTKAKEGIKLDSLESNEIFLTKSRASFISVNRNFTIPSDTFFNSQVYINEDKGSLNGDKYDCINYDNITMFVTDKKIRGPITLYKGFEPGSRRVLYCVTDGTHSAHSKLSYAKAISEYQTKLSSIKFFEQDTLSFRQLKDKIITSGFITVEDYRVLTGACFTGVQHFILNHGINGSKISLDDLNALIKEDDFGYTKFKKLYDDYKSSAFPRVSLEDTKALDKLEELEKFVKDSDFSDITC